MVISKKAVVSQRKSIITRKVSNLTLFQLAYQ